VRTYRTHFVATLEVAPGWYDDRNRNHKTVLPLYLRLDIPSKNLSCALSCLRQFCHKFLAQKMLDDRRNRPYELKCDWHTVQDEVHILLDYPHEHLVSLRTQHQLAFPPQYDDYPYDSPTREQVALKIREQKSQPHRAVLSQQVHGE